jgi:hypothetical protein
MTFSIGINPVNLLVLQARLATVEMEISTNIATAKAVVV